LCHGLATTKSGGIRINHVSSDGLVSTMDAVEHWVGRVVVPPLVEDGTTQRHPGILSSLLEGILDYINR
jgi:hypothetical protein